MTLIIIRFNESYYISILSNEKNPMKLILTLEKITFLIGGKLLKATGSTATKYEIEGGTIFEKIIQPIEKQTLSLSKFIKEELHITTKIDGTKYWKMSNDPKTYNK